ncbi:RagB/SusD family nutrient uptake outer membrane protein [uncultured Bacteroides sp.]|uniref:RagB/SusD family nutrient uptake outer membrane protein n=1 Tax=uncultured Bacteroides sp. TaxID=162156 RepID=UPI002AAA7880|nr:RagB/SusD family nutrient uptake outer membrane protein [uncultured Bacteroides sp.]
MKTNIFKSAVLAVGLLGFISCSDNFLNSDPITDVTEDNFYLNEKDFNRALVGCYDALRTIWDDGVAFPIASEIMSDDCFGGTGKGDGKAYKMLNNFNILTDAGNVNQFNNTWISYYKAIYRYNKLLSKLDKASVDTVARKRIEGETRFLRAYTYFDMVRLWGNIPLKLEPTDANEPQAKADDVYKVIASDLKFAADKMNSESWSGSWATDNDGHATSWAAKSLLARVFLFYTGYYNKETLPSNDGVITKQQVLAGLEDVITNGGFSLVPEYKNLWLSTSYKTLKKGGKSGQDILAPGTYAGEGNSEIVFAIKYNNTAYWDKNIGSNKWLVQIGVRGENAGYPYGQGWGGATVNPKLVEAFGTDPRKDLSIISVEKELPGTGIFKLAKHIEDMQDYTGYMNKKYTPLSNPDGTSYAAYVCPNTNTSFMICQFQDYFSIRYADVLLMAAELGSASAQDYFNQVRNRAYYPKTAPIRTVNKENIMKERMLEFAFEGFRYWDLLRQGIETAATTIEQAENGVEVKTAGQKEVLSVSAASIRATEGLQQIPNTQITLSNNLLKQNKGWE